ncbi:MFS transporter [Cnuibacter physcomitrellae]|uniref:MFS transporter n=1 Tax=Cnuibacter physcomitrellae TaxID=1619308 RepID=A0A1X9LMU6_9MICO|nr:MFS transporter [Cnuibacter physcomitrellae]ARJ05261.1 MFS transporter [Cnuibacter physcomitrellae]MCS5498557.1 MFS transporter [Cnuibacter physcomitrellae]GGI35313.1 MFS transporter [Cnuibacter physcomitrellae]
MSAILDADTVITARRRVRRAAVSGFFGSALEYYDFLVYGSASALIFGKLFFPESGAAATFLSIATFGVAYVVRPLGAVLWGHIGDRFGRRRALVLTIALMGIATFLIGALPTFQAIGYAASALLVLLRLVQGLSAGGESPGSTSLTVEHAPEGRRAWYTSFTMSGMQFGIALGSLVFIPVALLPEEALYSWGWRIPFLISGVFTVVAYLLRRKLDEPDTFTAMKADESRAKLPIAVLLKDHWRTTVRVLFLSTVNIVGTIFNVFALAYGTQNGIPSAVMLAVVSLGNLVAVVAAPLSGLLSDRFGRRPLFIVGSLGASASMALLFVAIDAGNIPMVYLTGVIGIGIFYCIPITVGATWYPEQFPAQVRYTGMAVGLMLGILLAGFAPAIAQGFGAGGTNWWPAILLCGGASIVSSLVAVFAPETFRTTKAALGVKA